MLLGEKAEEEDDDDEDEDDEDDEEEDEVLDRGRDEGERLKGAVIGLD